MKFRFVDRILSWTPYGSITGVKAVSFEEYSLKEALGEPPCLPESLLLESFLQLGNWLLLLSSDFREMGMIVRMAEIRFLGDLVPGQQVRMEVAFKRFRDEGVELVARGVVDGRTIVTGTGCLAIRVPAAEYVNPDDMRVLFSEIYRPEQAVTP